MNTVVLTQRVTESDSYTDRRDALSQEWIAWFEATFPGVFPVPLPNLIADVTGWVSAIKPDWVILTGGNDLGDAPDRDQTESRLLTHCLQAGIPVVAICRGMQFVSNYFGGQIAENRQHGQIREHEVEMVGGGIALCSHDRLLVNSFHNWCITRESLGIDLVPIAVQGHFVEAIVHTNYPVLGLMWHPERPHHNQSATNRLIAEFLRSAGKGDRGDG